MLMCLIIRDIHTYIYVYINYTVMKHIRYKGEDGVHVVNHLKED